MKTYTLDELIIFVKSERDNFKELSAMFEEDPEVGETIGKFEAVIEELHRLQKLEK